MNKKALIIGNSDGIGLNITKELLKREWEIVGISRSESPIEDSSYEHIVSEVQEDKYLEKLKSILENGKPMTYAYIVLASVNFWILQRWK